MKKKHELIPRFLIICSLLFLFSCTKSQHQNQAQDQKLAQVKSFIEKNYKISYSSVGTTTIALTRNNELLVMQNTDNDGKIDKIYLFAAEKGVKSPELAKDLGKSEVYVFGDGRSAVLYSTNKNTYYFFGINEPASVIRLADLAKQFPGDIKTDNGYYDYGISELMGQWDNAILTASGPFDYAVNILTTANLQRRSTVQPKEEFMPVCTSGGPGSNGCSQTWEILGVAGQCSVTCQTGWYSCCASSNTTCTCRQN